MEATYSLNGYPPPEHIYLGKSKLVVCTLFPRIQHGQLSESEYPDFKEGELGTRFRPEVPLFYDIEIRENFKTAAYKDEQYYATCVPITSARPLAYGYVEEWCEENGLELI